MTEKMPKDSASLGEPVVVPPPQPSPDAGAGPALHQLTYRRETRWSLYGVDPNLPGVAGYPCFPTCKIPSHLCLHNGQNVFIYACCSCGWESMVGDHINRSEANLEGRFQYLQHQIDMLRADAALAVFAGDGSIGGEQQAGTGTGTDPRSLSPYEVSPSAGE